MNTETDRTFAFNCLSHVFLICSYLSCLWRYLPPELYLNISRETVCHAVHTLEQHQVFLCHCRVTLLQNAPNCRAIHSSKAVGEPPFHLGASVFFALKEAVYSARMDAGLSGYFVLDAPCTSERLRMACVDDITRSYAPDTLRPKISC